MSSDGSESTLPQPSESGETPANFPSRSGNDAPIQEFSIAYWRGNLPHPDHLKAFGQIDPGFPQRIFDQAEQEQRHRHQFDDRRLEYVHESWTADVNAINNGRRSGFALALFFGILAFVLTLCGYPWVGGNVFSTTIVASLAAFVTGQLSYHKVEKRSDAQ